MIRRLLERGCRILPSRKEKERQKKKSWIRPGRKKGWKK